MANLTHRPDQPIKRSDEDRLGRTKFVDRLADAIISQNLGKSTGIVVGITGPWGCGKSSVLNLLNERISQAHPSAIVVRFNPWLVSGRDEIIADFFEELVGTIRSDWKRREQLKHLSTTIAEYGARIAPIGNVVLPGVGTAASAGLKAAKDALSTVRSLTQLRSQIIDHLENLSSPVVVLIDELDRVEDNEIRSVVQLVRSVADFPRISYVLAYDAHRVEQALGSGHGTDEKAKTGKEYLEKIVQFQIPMPITLREEVHHLINSRLDELSEESLVPENFREIERFQRLIEILCDGVIDNLRDIHRLLGTFHVLIGMLKGEVDTIDVLAYCALLVKAPTTVSMMRKSPADFLSDMISSNDVQRFYENENLSPPDKLERLIPESERNDGILNILQFLLPAFDFSGKRSPHPDAFDRRRPFLTTLRLGLLPGAYSRDEVKALLVSGRDAIFAKFQDSYGGGVLEQLMDRIAEIYMDIPSENESEIWAGVADFVRKSDRDWMQSYSPMYIICRDFCEMMYGFIIKEPTFRERAMAIFEKLSEQDDTELTSYWLHTHFFIYGLYGCENRGGSYWFLDAEQSQKLAQEMSGVWRNQHLAGQLITSLWALTPVFIMIKTGTWDDDCRDKINESLSRDEDLIGLALLLFGGNLTIESSTISKMCDHDLLVARAKECLAGPAVESIDETARGALQKVCASESAVI